MTSSHAVKVQAHLSVQGVLSLQSGDSSHLPRCSEEPDSAKLLLMLVGSITNATHQAEMLEGIILLQSIGGAEMTLTSSAEKSYDL